MDVLLLLRYVVSSDYTYSVTDCFGRVNAPEIQEGLAKGGGGEGPEESTIHEMEEKESDKLVEDARRITKKKKGKRILIVTKRAIKERDCSLYWCFRISIRKDIITHK